MHFIHLGRQKLLDIQNAEGHGNARASKNLQEADFEPRTGPGKPSQKCEESCVNVRIALTDRGGG